jgi:hypothetical protein
MGSARDMSTSSVHYDGSGSKERTCFLTSETQIILRTDHERRIFQQLKDWEFAHTKAYNNNVLDETSMIGEFGMLAQFAVSLPSSESGGIPGQPEPTREIVSVISTRWGKPSRRMYAPNHVGKLIHQIQDPWEELLVFHRKDNGYPTIMHNLLSKDQECSL